MPSIRHAILFSYLEKYGAFVISFGSSIVLARLLVPAEVGAFSVAAVVFGLAGLMRDFGLGNYIVQTGTLTAQKVQTAFTVALITGASLAMLLALVAFPIAAYYGNDSLRPLLWILSLNLLVSPIGSTTMALLARDLRFQDVAKVNLSAAVLNAGTAIACAWAGLSSLSLAWGMLASAAGTALLAQAYRNTGYPLRLTLGGAREMLHFGGLTTITNVSNETVNAVPDLALGKLASLHSVGEYSRANGLAQALNQTVLRGLWPVLLPYFSRLKEESGTAVSEAYLRLVAHVTGVSWAFFAMLILVAPELVRLLYGPAWMGAVPVLQGIATLSMFAVVFSFAIPVLTALGEVKPMARISLGSLLPRIGMIIAGAQQGPVGAAVGAGAANTLLGALLQVQVGRRLGVGAGALAQALRPSATLCLITCSGPLALRLWQLAGDPAWPFGATLDTPQAALGYLAAAGALAAIGGGIGLWCGRHPMRALIAGLLARRGERA